MPITTRNFANIGVGSSPNDGTGDDLRSAFIRVNENFSNVSAIGFNTGNINCRGSIEVLGNVLANGFTGGNITLTGNITAANVVGSFGVWGTVRTAAQTSITSLGTLTGLTVNNTTTAVSIGASATTGTFILGGTTATGSIGIGRSTASQTVNIANGAVSSGNVKTLNIGTGGVSGSTTNILLGTNTSGATGNIRILSNINLESTYIPSTASSSGQPGQIIWDTNYIYVCVASNTWKRANLVAW